MAFPSLCLPQLAKTALVFDHAFAMCVHDSQLSELDCSFSCSHHTNDGRTPHEVFALRFQTSQVLTTWVRKMEEAENRCKTKYEFDQFLYGNKENEKVDIWGSIRDQHILLFIHGGFWIERGRSDVTVIAEAVVPVGVLAACVGYKLATKDHSLAKTVDNFAYAMRFILKRYPTMKIFLGGHSAGAHLAMKAAKYIPNERLAGLVLVAGVYDVAGLEGTQIFEQLGVTPEQARKCSATVEDVAGKTGFVYQIDAENESPPMSKRQEELHNELKQAGFNAHREVIPCSNHFSLMEDFANPNSVTTQLLRRLLKH